MTYPANQRSILIDKFHAEAAELEADRGLKAPDLYSETIRGILGLDDTVVGTHSDGKGDRGIDYFIAEDTQFELWQFKSTTAFESEIEKKIDPSSLEDVRRALEFIQTIEQDTKESLNPKIKKLRNTIVRKLQSIRDQQSDELLQFTIYHCCLRNGLTDQAKSELDQIRAQAAKTDFPDVLAQASIQILDFEDILGKIYQRDNNKWTVGESFKKPVSLKYERKIIEDGRTLIFFCEAKGLINAYEELGHQMFNANVRSYLKQTSVNKKIQKSLSTQKGVNNFKYLNNGLNIICERYEKKRLGEINVMKPEVINGLQTLKTIYDYTSDHSDKDHRKYIEENLKVLVRLYSSDNVPFLVTDLVVATNNQNKMEARNLRSNDEVQIAIERGFADHGWFYERKQMGWEAFSDADGKWPTLKGSKPKDFGPVAKNRRKVDNVSVGVAWTALSGFSDVARSSKTKLFEQDELYEITFNMIPAGHGFDYRYNRKNIVADSDSERNIPSSSNLLLSVLLYQCAKAVPSNKVVNQHWTDKGIGDESRYDIPEYIKHVIPASAPLIFVEFFGYFFLQVPLQDRDKVARWILEKSDLQEIFRNGEPSLLQDVFFESKNLAPNEIVRAIFSMYMMILEDWGRSAAFVQEMLGASSRPSFLDQKRHRDKLFTRVDELEKTIAGRELLQPWSGIFDKHRTVKNILRKLI